MELTDSGRAQIVNALYDELFGPRPGSPPRRAGRPIALDPPPVFESFESARGPWHEAATGEEILTRDPPVKRYGVGVLYPQQQQRTDANEGEALSLDSDPAEEPLASTPIEVPELGSAETDADDFDLSATADYRPSAMAVSFLASTRPGDRIQVALTGGRYEEVRVTIAGRERLWFVRRPVAHTFTFSAGHGLFSPDTPVSTEPLALRAQLLGRAQGGSTLYTVAVINEAPSSRRADTGSLFQAAFTVTVIRDGETVAAILPYPDARSERLLERDPETRSLDLLYRNAPTFGVGHGCAATWDEPWGAHTCSAVHATALPTFEAPSVTPDITIEDGTSLRVPLGPLAGYDPADDGWGPVRTVVEAYASWIHSLEKQAGLLTGHRAAAAADHIEKCWRAYRRMAAGAEWLQADPIARRAFMLANRAVLEQQLHYGPGTRAARVAKRSVISIEPAKPVQDWRAADRSWRAFQIGFLLAAARSTVNGDDPDRETVELIFFPTGGGKTEAYLGLSAFTLFYQRLSGRRPGTTVLMRYTLRLLTSQQFLRAAALVCAMEIIRLEEQDLGDEPFTIGIWVGSDTTPNTSDEARRAYKALLRGSGDNPFLVTRCPWCAAQMGPVEVAPGVSKAEGVLGYRDAGGTIEFRCPDRACAFRRSLPVFVIDDEIYKHRPSILIATVDKLAMLAYRPQARSLFGIGPDGQREVDPPNLIIQDELHLISGPLGSMVGLYEPIIERLCTAAGPGGPTRPKIVGSTATIRNYAEQIKGLYGRTDAVLFPPHGLDASDAFFARYARDPDTGAPVQGRLYVGVHAPGLGSIQTAQVRVGAALLQGALSLPEHERDPWWTSLMFFNSLRELGVSVSLLQSDIPDYLWAMKLRDGHAETRRVARLMELTSRMRQDEVPRALEELERTWSSGKAIDACLASSIVEVGVDIPRLSLITVLGQPKSTSQYIQVTGRVGREWWSRPGLVVTIYSASRPRDRSHFERFQSYHQRLYAEVEPVSVTPFSTPVLKRAGHAAVIVHARQNGPIGLEPSPLPGWLLDEGNEILEQRAAISDPEALGQVKRELARRRAEWVGWEPATWDGADRPLMRRAGEWVEEEVRRTTWATPMSMRNVDAECRAVITDRYAIERGGATSEEGS